MLGSRFGENVGNLINRRDEPNLKSTKNNLLMDKVKIHFNIFGVIMKHWIKTQICGSKIIALQKRNMGLKDL